MYRHDACVQSAMRSACVRLCALCLVCAVAMTMRMLLVSLCACMLYVCVCACGAPAPQREAPASPGSEAPRERRSMRRSHMPDAPSLLLGGGGKLGLRSGLRFGLRSGESVSSRASSCLRCASTEVPGTEWRIGDAIGSTVRCCARPAVLPMVGDAISDDSRDQQASCLTCESSDSSTARPQREDGSGSLAGFEAP
jgi:hypothetical protein